MFGCIKAVSQRKVGCCLAEQRSIGLHSSLISYTIVGFRSVVVSPKLLISPSAILRRMRAVVNFYWYASFVSDTFSMRTSISLEPMK
jgi:hypothetical protein